MATATRPMSGPAAALQLNMLSRKQRSLWGDAWYRLSRNKMAMLGLGIIITMSVIAIFADRIAPYDPTSFFTDNGKRAPTLFEPVWGNPKYVDPRYMLGTDAIGRDILSRLVYSLRISMIVGFVPVSIIFVLGVTVGMLAGYIGGWVDDLLMRLTDVIYAFPDLLFLILLMATLRGTGAGDLLGGLLLLFVGIAVVNWVGMARLMRGQVLSLKEKEFVEAARSIGAKPGRIMFRHIFPNALAPLIVAVAFGVPGAILAEATLGYLGIGIKPPTATLGVMINDGFAVFSATQWPLLLPAFMVAIVLLSFTFLGDGLRDALDPRMKI